MMRGPFCFPLLMTVILAASLFIPSPAQGTTRENEDVFFKANQDYRSNRFKEAVEGYNRLIESGYENGHLHYNLGNAYFRMDDLGRAILHYEKARLLIPRDADLNFNLRLARDRLQDDVPGSQGFIDQTFFWIRSLTLSELFRGFALVNVMFFGILLVRLFWKPEWTYYGLILIFIFWGLTGLSFGLKWFQVSHDRRAVILEKEVNIMAGPDPRDTVLFKLHEGTTVSRERSEDGWSLIHLPDKKRGWIRSDAMEGIVR